MAHVALKIKIPQLAIRNKMWFVLMKEIFWPAGYWYMYFCEKIDIVCSI